MNNLLKNSILSFEKEKNLKPSKTVITDKYLNQYVEEKVGDSYHQKYIGNKKKDGTLSEVEASYYNEKKMLCPVLTNLYISNAESATTEYLIVEHKITHIVNLATGIECPFEKICKYKRIHIEDLPTSQLPLEDTFDFIQEAL